MASEEDKTFRDEMSDVVPLKGEKRVDLRRTKRSNKDSSATRRRQAAVQGIEPDRNSLTEGDMAPINASAVLQFQRPGIQNNVFRKLKQGRYEIEADIDLHRMTVAIARQAVFDGIEQCSQQGLRSIIIVHGKGQGSSTKEGGSTLKACVDRWLRDLGSVQAFHSAQPKHGGTGAVYVLLRNERGQ
jgi:DNA-nicking Smr family endonuclease